MTEDVSPRSAHGNGVLPITARRVDGALPARYTRSMIVAWIAWAAAAVPGAPCVELSRAPAPHHPERASAPRERACILATTPKLLGFSASGAGIALRESSPAYPSERPSERPDEVYDANTGELIIGAARFVSFSGDRARIELPWPRGCL